MGNAVAGCSQDGCKPGGCDQREWESASEFCLDAKEEDCDQREWESAMSQRLLRAAGDGDHTMIKKLLVMGADVNCKVPLTITTSRRTLYGHEGIVTPRGFTPLMYAAQDGNLRCVDLLVAAGALVNIFDEENTTPLHLGVSSESMAVCIALLVAGADHQAKDLQGRGVLDYLPRELSNDAKQLKTWTSLMEVAHNRRESPPMLHDLLDVAGCDVTKEYWDALFDVAGSKLLGTVLTQNKSTQNPNFFQVQPSELFTNLLES